MTRGIEYIRLRALNTRGAQDAIKADWLWPEKTVADWDADLADLNLKEEAANAAERAMMLKRGLLDRDLDDLHDRTVQGITMARVAHRGQPEVLALLAHLKGAGQGRAATMQEALDWEKAWDTLPDADWNPTVANIKAAFRTLRLQAQTGMEEMTAAHSAWRKLKEDFNQAAGELYGNCVAWYGAACAVFSEETATGRLVRGVVPTVTTSRPIPVPPDLSSPGGAPTGGG